MASSRHTDRHYESQLAELQQRLLLMAGRVEEMIAQSIKALVDRDTELARQIIVTDSKVNTAEIEADELCLSILARRQPMGSDLRLLTVAIRMVTDLERIGDLAVNICERVIDLSTEPPLASYADISRMADLARSMVHDALDAFVERDPEKARQVIRRDDDVDELYTWVFRDLLDIMRRDPAAIERGIHVQSIAKWLERIGDHSTNIAEQVIFVVKGQDVRHSGKLSSPPAKSG